MSQIAPGLGCDEKVIAETKSGFKNSELRCAFPPLIKLMPGSEYMPFLLDWVAAAPIAILVLQAIGVVLLPVDLCVIEKLGLLILAGHAKSVTGCDRSFRIRNPLTPGACIEGGFRISSMDQGQDIVGGCDP